MSTATHKPHHHPKTSASVVFIQKIAPVAQQVSRQWHVPASVLIAQAALESGWGQHVKGNAYFGIKGHAPSGATVNFATTEFVKGKKTSTHDNFRAYKDFADAANDYGRFLASNPRYAAAFKTGDADSFVDVLQKAGYATDPQYAKKLKSIIHHNKLTQYDVAGPKT